MMNTRRSQLYLAHASTAEAIEEFEDRKDGYAAEVEPGEAAEYIASLLASLRPIALRAQFRLLSDLIAVAEEEAQFHCRA